jgi:hypothetical protein
MKDNKRDFINLASKIQMFGFCVSQYADHRPHARREEVLEPEFGVCGISSVTVSHKADGLHGVTLKEAGRFACCVYAKNWPALGSWRMT